MNWKPILYDGEADHSISDLARECGFSEMVVSHDTEKPIYLGRRRMIDFGYRLTGGFVVNLSPDSTQWESGFWHEVDICCGQAYMAYLVIFGAVKMLIEQNGRDCPFKGIPAYSRIKPWYNDQSFIDDINKKMGL